MALQLLQQPSTSQVSKSAITLSRGMQAAPLPWIDLHTDGGETRAVSQSERISLLHFSRAKSGSVSSGV